MNDFQLRIRGYQDNKNVECIRPVFCWTVSSFYGQFTIEMAKDDMYKKIVFLRDTHEHFYAYDSIELQPHTTYYIRVRSGMGAWSTTSFTTGEQ